jgi:hypothetical protein
MMNTGNEAGLARAINWVQHALITAYKDNCPLQSVKTGRSSLRWTVKLESLRKGVRRLFSKSRRDQNPHSWEPYREAQQVYRKEVQKASKETWRAFCSSINDSPKAARLQRALSKDPKVRLGSLVALSGGHTQSKGDTLDLLLHTHFPDLEAIEEGVASIFTGRATRLDWQVATKDVTNRRVIWATHSFAPYKSPGMDGILPALLQEGQEVLVPYLVRIFCTCLATGYVPTTWRQVKVVFIPKPGRDSYGMPKDYTPISLTLFLLKTMERLIDRFLRDEILVSLPLHPNQHAYQPTKSAAMALHQLVVRIEKALDQRETALGVFLDIEGAFNNTSYNSICAPLAKHGVSCTIIQRIRATLEGWLATDTLGGVPRRVKVARGCPQGGVLSPLLWCLAVDELIAGLNGGGIHAQGYADNMSSSCGKITEHSIRAHTMGPSLCRNVV